MTNLLFFPQRTILLTAPGLLSWVDYVITFIPIFFFLLVFFKIFKVLKADKVSMKDILLDKDMQVSLKKEETKQKEALISANVSLVSKGVAPLNVGLLAEDPQQPDPTATVAPKDQQSMSRLLALISGMVSVGLACCITSFYIWRYVNKDVGLSLTHLVNVLLALGIGVVPYAFSKVTNILK